MIKILLIKKGAIGDLLMATPLIRQLKQQLNCKLDIIVGKSAAIAISNNAYLDQQIILDDKLFTSGGILKLCRELIRLRGNYNYVFVLDKHWLFNLLAKIIGGTTVGYYRDSFSKILLNKSVHYYDINRYHGLYYLDLLYASGLKIPDYCDLKLDLTIKYEDEQHAMDYMNLQAIDNFVVVVNSGGNNAYETNGLRMLPTTQVLKLIRALLATEQVVVLSGGKLDFANYEMYRKELNFHPRLINAAGKLDLAASGYMFKCANHVYTTDCGAMHIAIAMQLADKLSTFFGPSNPKHILPQEYLPRAIWNDQQIYNTKYQLYGMVRDVEPIYFSKLDISDEIICNHNQ